MSHVQGAEAVTTTPIEPPAHVVQGTPFLNEMPLPHFFGSGTVVAMLKKKWEPITGDDLEAACGHAIRPGDVLIPNIGWHKRCDGRGASHPSERSPAGNGNRAATQRAAAAASEAGMLRLVGREIGRASCRERV